MALFRDKAHRHLAQESSGFGVELLANRQGPSARGARSWRAPWGTKEGNQTWGCSGHQGEEGNFKLTLNQILQLSWPSPRGTGAELRVLGMLTHSILLSALKEDTAISPSSQVRKQAPKVKKLVQGRTASTWQG